MKTTLILIFMLMARLASAFDLAPVTWIHTATSNEVYVAAYWWTQFPNRADADGRHLCIAVPKTTWQGWGATKRAELRTAIGKLLSGQVRLSRANLPTWKTRLDNAGITAQLVMPGDTPTVGAKLYIIVCAKGEQAAARLRSFGLEPPVEEEP